MRAPGVILCIALITSAVAQAGEEATDSIAIAHDRFKEGVLRYQAGDYEAAITSWQDGYHNQPAPEFLFNMARAYQRLHRAEQALLFYTQYLDLAPDARNRPDAERQVASLKRHTKRHHRPEAPPPEPEIAQEMTDAPPPAHVDPPPSPAPRGASLQPVTVTTSPPPDADTDEAGPKPLYFKAWFWGVMGAVTTVVVGGVVLGVELGTRTSQGNFMTVRF